MLRFKTKCRKFEAKQKFDGCNIDQNLGMGRLVLFVKSDYPPSTRRDDVPQINRSGGAPRARRGRPPRLRPGPESWHRQPLPDFFFHFEAWTLWGVTPPHAPEAQNAFFKGEGQARRGISREDTERKGTRRFSPTLLLKTLISAIFDFL